MSFPLRLKSTVPKLVSFPLDRCMLASVTTSSMVLTCRTPPSLHTATETRMVNTTRHKPRLLVACSMHLCAPRCESISHLSALSKRPLDASTSLAGAKGGSCAMVCSCRFGESPARPPRLIMSRRRKNASQLGGPTNVLLFSSSLSLSLSLSPSLSLSLPSPFSPPPPFSLLRLPLFKKCSKSRPH